MRKQSVSLFTNFRQIIQKLTANMSIFGKYRMSYICLYIEYKLLFVY